MKNMNKPFKQSKINPVETEQNFEQIIHKRGRKEDKQTYEKHLTSLVTRDIKIMP